MELCFIANFWHHQLWLSLVGSDDRLIQQKVFFFFFFENSKNADPEKQLILVKLLSFLHKHYILIPENTLPGAHLGLKPQKKSSSYENQDKEVVEVSLWTVSCFQGNWEHSSVHCLVGIA